MCAYSCQEYKENIISSPAPIASPQFYQSPGCTEKLPSSFPMCASPTPSVLKTPNCASRPRPKKLYFESLGIPSTKHEADIQYHLHKCKLSKPILKQNWTILLPKCSNFITIVDKDKVAFDVSAKELNTILDSGFFTDKEVKVIKKMRYQGRNNMAAKAMREKYKLRDRKAEFEVTKLEQTKLTLIQEKANLMNEIIFYQKGICNSTFHSTS